MRSSIVRPSWLVTHRQTLLLSVAIVAGFSYIVWLLALRPEPRTIPVSIPVTVPIPVVTPLAPPAQPAPADVAQPRPGTRLVTPRLIASCEIQQRFTDEPPCGETGVPAISEDGSTIAALYSEGEGSLKVRFITAATSKIVDDIAIQIPADTLDERGLATPATRAAIGKRVATVQAKLDAGRYRGLVSIQQVDLGSEAVHGALSMLYDPSGDSPEEVSVLDEDADLTLWTDRFVATERGYPARANEAEVGPDCYPSKTSSIATWWDARTRTILAEVPYIGWACDCPTWATQHYVRHAATP